MDLITIVFRVDKKLTKVRILVLKKKKRKKAQVWTIYSGESALLLMKIKISTK